MKTVFLFLLFFLSFSTKAQLIDAFSDGDFTNAPTWSGTDVDFIVNAGFELQINAIAAGTSYLSTPHNLTTLNGQEWNLTVRQTFAPSSSNFGRIYLTSSGSDLSTNPDGFYLQLGEAGSVDAVRLFKSVGGASTQITAAPDGQIATSFAIGIRVVRDAAGNWRLYVDPTGGSNYGAPFLGTDATNLLGTHFGVLGTYTASNATKFYFDNVYVGPEIFDTQAPVLTSVSALSATTVDVLFSEPVGGPSATQLTNYTFLPTIGVQSATIDGANSALVHLVLSTTMTNGQNYQLTVGSITDLSANTSNNLTANFTYLVGEVALPGDIIINEIMADATPVIGLPELEFIEIYNKSTKYIDLTGWKLGDASGDGTITSGFIQPGEYKILVASSSLADYPAGIAVSSFPSFNNSGDDVVLKDASLLTINKVSYTDDWYKDAIKQDGGYTLELINPNDPCSDINNWIASNAAIGGTPAAQNSVFSTVPDATIPQLVSTNAFAPNILEVNFNEGMDSTSLVNAAVSVNPALTISSILASPIIPNSALIYFNETLQPSQLYSFTYGNVADCWLNQTTISGNFALAENPAIGDIVINEILFDPGTGGTDFIELYNKSSKVLNLKDYNVSNFDNDTISNPKYIDNNYILFPGEYVVLTADSNFVKSQFSSTIAGNFYQMSLPSLNNDSSTIYLQFGGVTLDKVSYLADWHLSLIDDTENKTLERIDPNGPSSNSSNWHTAAETVGFGTPGALNSQYQIGTVAGDFGTTEAIFSPDNDGFQDVLIFYYQMEQPGMIATLKIFDDQGRLKKTLLKSELLAKEGTFTWDGVNDDNLKAPIGIYLAVIECFSVDNTANFSKRIAFTLGGKLN